MRIDRVSRRHAREGEGGEGAHLLPARRAVLVDENDVVDAKDGAHVLQAGRRVSRRSTLRKREGSGRTSTGFEMVAEQETKRTWRLPTAAQTRRSLHTDEERQCALTGA